MKPQIPVIDLTDARSSDRDARLRLGRQIDRTCTEIGSFTITGHGVPADTITGLNRKAHEFFALPMAEKQEVMPADIKSPRGYKPIGYEALGHGNANMTPPRPQGVLPLRPRELARRALLHGRARGSAISSPTSGRAGPTGSARGGRRATTREMETPGRRA